MSHIVTFYSYKGGVGRTFLLANIAVLLARRGRRVLIMDWDLEAPGLDRFFSGSLPPSLPRDKGVLPMLCAAAADPAATWGDHVVPIKGLKQNARLSLIPSGAASPDYARQLHEFSWQEFFAGKVGGPVLERWRSEWKEAYDFILVDSRTGLSDIGGVCTILLPDVLAAVFTASHQSTRGVRAVIDSAQQERRKLDVPRLPLAVLPIPARFDGREEVDLGEKWLDKFAEIFSPVMQTWLPVSVPARDMLVKLKVPYVSRFSFGEDLAVETYDIKNTDYPGYYIVPLAELLDTSFASVRKLFPQADRAAHLEEVGPPQGVELGRDLRSFFADQMEGLTFFVFSLSQAGVLAGLGLLAGWLPRVHDLAGARLPPELRTAWDNTHHELTRFVGPSFLVSALALLAIGCIVTVTTAVRTFLAYWRKDLLPPATKAVTGELRRFAWHCLGAAVMLAVLFLVSVGLNVITAWPLAWLLPAAPSFSMIAGWFLTGLGGALLLLGLGFAFLQHLRSALPFFRPHRRSTE